MKIIQYNFDQGIELINLGDVHRGDFCHNNKTFMRVVNYINDHSNVYWVSTGDLLNVALRNSKSNVYASKSPQDEFDLLMAELKPIANKCLGIVKSNHHARFDRETGLSLDQLITERLEIPFLGGIGVVNITCGAAAYFIVIHHGIGMGKMRGGKTNNTEYLSRVVPGADIYLEGHTHSFDHFINEAQNIDRKRNIVSSIPVHFVVTGHFLDWEDSYAADLKLPPMPLGSARMILKWAGRGNAINKSVKVDLIQ